MFDICIIGAGVVGAAIARELSKYDLSIVLLEKQGDVSCGASKANSGIVHGGYAAKHGTLKGELCLKGNRMFKKMNEELNFGYKKTGALVVGFNDNDLFEIKRLYENGIKNGCEDMEILTGEQAKHIEPKLGQEVKYALYSTNVGIASPYELTIALVENAITNGVELLLNYEVTGISKTEGKFTVSTNNGNIDSRYVINCGGAYSDRISAMVGIDYFKILPRRGQYILLGTDQGRYASKVIFQVPTDKGKGILVTPTFHGNLMIGPDAEEASSREDVATDLQGINQIISTARKSIEGFDIKRALTTFSGIRAISSTGDFIIKEEQLKGFINVAGIDSPGLTSSLAIGELVSGILEVSGIKLIKKETFAPNRRGIVIKKNSDFQGRIEHSDMNKNIICRCEKVTEAEIVDAMCRGICFRTTDGIKRRTRAGMGNCQGNFCRDRVKKIMSRELGIEEENITVRGGLEGDKLERVDINLVRNS